MLPDRPSIVTEPPHLAMITNQSASLHRPESHCDLINSARGAARERSHNQCFVVIDVQTAPYSPSLSHEVPLCPHPGSTMTLG